MDWQICENLKRSNKKNILDLEAIPNLIIIIFQWNYYF